MIQQAIARLLERQDLSRADMAAAMNEIADGGATPAQVGAFLAALRLKGETVDEIAGAVSTIIARTASAAIFTGASTFSGKSSSTSEKPQAPISR